MKPSIVAEAGPDESARKVRVNPLSMTLANQVNECEDRPDEQQR